jgi:integrase
MIRAIFEIGIEAGARRDNPAKAKEMKRLRETPKRLRLPEHEQFEKFVQKIATSGCGHSKPCAELVQFLAYGGFRINEAKYITWADCDFKRGKITVCGEPETGLKGPKDSCKAGRWRSKGELIRRPNSVRYWARLRLIRRRTASLPLAAPQIIQRHGAAIGPGSSFVTGRFNAHTPMPPRR